MKPNNVCTPFSQSTDDPALADAVHGYARSCTILGRLANPVRRRTQLVSLPHRYAAGVSGHPVGPGEGACSILPRWLSQWGHPAQGPGAPPSHGSARSQQHRASEGGAVLPRARPRPVPRVAAFSSVRARRRAPACATVRNTCAGSRCRVPTDMHPRVLVQPVPGEAGTTSGRRGQRDLAASRSQWST